MGVGGAGFTKLMVIQLQLKLELKFKLSLVKWEKNSHFDKNI